MVKMIDHLSKHDHYYSGTNQKKYIAIHETANRSVGAGAWSHARLQANGNSRQASWNWQVDDEIAIRSYPEDRRTWHAGDSEYGLNSISVEICVNRDGDYDKALQNAAELVAYLRKKFDIPWNRVISHKFITGKQCPAIMLADGRWDEFIKASDPKNAGKVTVASGGSEASAPQQYDKRKVITDDAEIKAGRSRGSETIGTPSKGYRLNIVEDQGSWTKVRWNYGTSDEPDYRNAYIATVDLEKKPAEYPHVALKRTDKHTRASHNAWVTLMAAVDYTDPDLGKNLQSWLNDLTDPRTGRGYYDLSKYRHDGIMGPIAVKGLQRKLYDTSAIGKKHLYYGVADGYRGPLTVRAEIDYLNWQRQFLTN
jgi:N-acetylmuramoyl-L-alanine amidase CwlA